MRMREVDIKNLKLNTSEHMVRANAAIVSPPSMLSIVLALWTATSRLDTDNATAAESCLSTEHGIGANGD